MLVRGQIHFFVSEVVESADSGIAAEDRLEEVCRYRV